MKFLPLILLLVACRPAEPTPPYWDDVCVESHRETRTEMGGCGMSIDGHYDCNPGRLRNVTRTVCDRRERQCVVPRDWAGDPTCQEDVQ